MSGFKRLPFLVLLATLAVTSARAQIAGHPVEAAVGAGWQQFDVRDHIKNSPLGNVSLGYRWSTGLTFEGAWLGTSTKRVFPFPDATHTFTWTGVDLRWSLRDPSERVTPYIITGLGFGRSRDKDLGLISRRGAPSAGAGVLMSVMGKERVMLRLQVRDIMLREANSDGYSNHIAATAALQWSWRGKSKDQDLDGVRNWLDKCANTALGAKVDAKGCPIEVVERETELFDTGLIRLNNVNFDTGKASLMPESFPTLDAVGAVLLKWPQLKIEVGGHTDSRGSVAKNLTLSQARADSVRAHVLGKYPTLLPAQFTVKGYGMSKPFVPNTNDLNRAMNRRVEFVVVNKDVLRKEVEKRHLLLQGEGAPADTTKK